MAPDRFRASANPKQAAPPAPPPFLLRAPSALKTHATRACSVRCSWAWLSLESAGGSSAFGADVLRWRGAMRCGAHCPAPAPGPSPPWPNSASLTRPQGANRPYGPYDAPGMSPGRTGQYRQANYVQATAVTSDSTLQQVTLPPRRQAMCPARHPTRLAAPCISSYVPPFVEEPPVLASGGGGRGRRGAPVHAVYRGLRHGGRLCAAR